MVKGRKMALRTKETIFAARARSLSKAAPDPPWTTLRTGHPMLMSTRSAPCPSTILAASAMVSGREPKICTARGRSSGQLRNSRWVAFWLRTSPSALIISVQTSAHPCSLARSRKGRSEIPERGARRRGLASDRDPIFNGCPHSTVKENLPFPIDGHES